jgi:prolipoprotein diacylglyceryltransferase
MMGMIKEPEQLQFDQKQNYLLYGVSFACIVLVSCFMIQHIIEKNNQKKRQKYFNTFSYND